MISSSEAPLATPLQAGEAVQAQARWNIWRRLGFVQTILLNTEATLTLFQLEGVDSANQIGIPNQYLDHSGRPEAWCVLLYQLHNQNRNKVDYNKNRLKFRISNL